MGIDADAARAEKARNLRYRSPGCVSLNWQRMRDDLSVMADDIYEARWMDGPYTLLEEAMDESGAEMTREFEIAFGALSGEMNQMWEDMRQIEEYEREYLLYEKPDEEYDDPPRYFDMFFLAIGLNDMMMGFDIVEHDYFGIEPGLYRTAREAAQKHLKRLTKDQLLELVGFCMNVARQYLSLRARYDSLSASIGILKGRHEETLRVVKGIEEMYERAEEATEGFRYEWQGGKALNDLDHALEELPDRFWVE